MKIDYWEIIKNTLLLLWDLWPIWVIALFFIGIRLFFDWLDLEINNWRIRRKFRKGEKWRSDRNLLQWLRGMKPSEFEDYIADLFRRLGYKARAVGESHDGGIDVILEKDSIVRYVQCKKFITSVVPVSSIRDFYGAIADHQTNGKGYFITTNKFTLEAERFAEDKPIELIDGFKLIDYIRMAEKETKTKNLGINNSEVCPKCGGHLIEKKSKFGLFYGCSNFPKCNYTVNKK